MAILGISAHKTTHYHAQQVSMLNGGWVADPVQTAAMQGAVGGSSPAETVMQAVRTGQGQALKQYYQYATRRFRKRNCHWSIHTKRASKEFEIGLNHERVKMLVPELKDKDFRIIHDIDYLSVAGSKTFEDLSKEYGWDDFSEPLPDGTNIIFTGAEAAAVSIDSAGELNNSWVVGIETSRNLPVVILDPSVDKTLIKTPYYLLDTKEWTPELSGGVVYWSSSKGFKSSGKKNNLREYRQTVEEFKKFQDTYLVSTDPAAEPVEVGRVSKWIDPRKKEFTTNTDVIPDDGSYDTPVRTEIIEPIEKITVAYTKVKEPIITVHPVNGGETLQGYIVEVWEEDGVIEYDEVGYVWATKDLESHSGVAAFFTEQPLLSMNQLGSSKSSTWFKFYPYLPVKEWEQMVLDFGRGHKYLNALRQVSNSPENPTEADAPKVNRKGSRVENKSKKKPHASRSAVRITSNKKRYTRKIKVTNRLGFEPSDERHFNKMGELLNIDYKEIASTLAINENIDKVYQASIMPAVTLGSNLDEVNTYWYDFFNRLYRKIGQSSYLNFVDAVDKLQDSDDYKDIYKLPRVELNYSIPHGQFGGFMTFAFIQKFRLQGRIRTTKGKRGLKEVKLGKLAKLHEIKNIRYLKELLKNPSKEFIYTEYYKSEVSGKEYAVGGADLYVDISQYAPSPPPPDPPPPVYDDNKPMDAIAKFKAQRWLQQQEEEYFGHAQIIRRQSDIARLVFARYGYTFFCKDVGNGYLDVIAVAGLVGGLTRSGFVEGDHTSTQLNGLTLAARSIQDIAMFWERNKQQFRDKVPKNNIDVKAVFTEGSSRRILETTVHTFFIVPLDYKTLTRMSGLEVLRLANRACLTVAWSKNRVRTLQSWVKPVIQIIGIIVTIVGIIYGDMGATGVTILSIVETLAYAVVIQLAVKYGLQMLIRVFNLKGFIALIVAIVIMVVVSMFGGFGSTTSSLPYASQTASAQVASTATVQAVNTTVQQSILNSLKEMVQNMIKETVNNFVNMTSQEMLNNAMNVITKLADTMNQALTEQQQDIAEQLRRSTEEYNAHMKELEELQELDRERTAPYDIKVAMEGLLNKSKLIDPDGFLLMALNADNALASEEYISQFISNKLNLDPAVFDSIKSLDYSLKMEGI